MDFQQQETRAAIKQIETINEAHIRREMIADVKSRLEINITIMKYHEHIKIAQSKSSIGII
jgi:hypothetical protein